MAIKVIFTAGIKNPIPDEFLNKVRGEAEKSGGLVSFSVSTENNIETAVSVWDSMESVLKWKNNPVHIEAKNKKSDYYDWVDIEFIEEKEEQ